MNTAKHTRTRSWKRASPLAIAGMLVLASGCGGGGSSATPVAARTLYGNVNGINNAPQVNTQVAGRVSAQSSDERSPVKLTVNLSSLRTDFQTQEANITRVTINSGAFGQNGPVLFTLYDKAKSPLAVQFPAMFTGAVNASNLTPAPGAGINSYRDAVRAIRSGNTYLQISTQRYPNGEARGQIGQDRLGTFLSQIQIEPFPNVNTRGVAQVQVNAAQRRIAVVITIQGTQEVPDVQGIEIHFGLTRQEGVKAPVIFRVSGPVPGNFPRTFTKVLTAADFLPAPQRGLRTFDEFLEQVPVVGNTPNNAAFINVRTRRFPNGELRGTIEQDSVRQPMSSSPTVQ